MKKKKIVLLTSILSVAVFSSAALLFSNQGKTRGLSAGDDVNEYTITFTKSDSASGSYVGYYYSFDLHKTKGIDEKYDIDAESGPYSTYVGANTKEQINFNNPNNIAEVNCAYTSWSVQVKFALVERASVDLDKSVLDIYIDGVYQKGNKFIQESDEDPEWNYYTCYASGYQNSGTVELRQVKLVFSCPK